MSAASLAPAQLLRLLHLASPGLPVGAYSYSQGLEAAIEAGHVANEAGAATWIAGVLTFSMARLEAPLWCRLYRAWNTDDADAVARWSQFFMASRDSAELRAETVQMGYSLARLLLDLFPDDARVLRFPADLTQAMIPYPSAMAAACVVLGTPLEASLHAYLFSWAENQVLAALKAVPLGQVAGQRLLFALEPQLLAAAATALMLADDDISNWTPGLSFLCMRHETQYSRIFRS